MKKNFVNRKRVAEYAEVYTSDKEVNSMLDLVRDESYRIDSRFLEPACGNGNFLNFILIRKLSVLNKNFKHNQFEFEKNCIVIFGSIYGIDIIEDNVKSARERLFKTFLKVYHQNFKDSYNKFLIKSVKFILKKNIVYGDAISLKKPDSDIPIIFSEWAMINYKLKRREFTFKDLVAYSPFEDGSLFSDLGDEINIAKQHKDYPLVDFDRAFEAC